MLSRFPARVLDGCRDDRTDIAAATGGVYQGLISANGYRTLLPQLAGDIGRKHRLVSTQFRS